MKDEERMPIGFAMALSHDPVALRRFLRLENDQQDHILACARQAGGFVDTQELVWGMLHGDMDKNEQNPCNRVKNVIE
ncbi:MAG: hypothetical protein J6D21_09190 [Clostridia bacterium]|nr:hypothetical protein [Clostridia bacterium]